MSALFEPLTLRGVSIRNRIWVSPMCQYSVFAEDGVPTEWHRVHLGSFAVGGAGLVVAEATAVNPEGRISSRDTGIWNDEQAAAWAPIARFIQDQGAVAGIQLAHAGRKGSIWPAWGTSESGTVPSARGGWRAVAPSAIAFEGYAEPMQLDEAGIRRIIDDFTAAARRSVDAGFEVLEVHAAHGYLIHQFLSPLSNRRDDAWGGDLEHRARLLIEVVRSVRAAVGDAIAVLVRFSATDYVDGGWDEAQTAQAAAWAIEAGADFIDVSSGGLMRGATVPLAPGYQVGFAERLRHEVEVGTAAVGLITTPTQAHAIVAEGRADAVFLGRAMLRDPHFALRAAYELGAEIEYWPGQYLRAKPRGGDW